MKPGDTVEVPDGAGFDHFYFEVAEAEAPKPRSPKPASNDGEQ
jgi:hypothetical protein